MRRYKYYQRIGIFAEKGEGKHMKTIYNIENVGQYDNLEVVRCELEEQLEYDEDDYEGFLNDIFPDMKSSDLPEFSVPLGTCMREFDSVMFRGGMMDEIDNILSDIIYELTCGRDVDSYNISVTIEEIEDGTENEDANSEV